jgi:hypothetical protein
MMRNKGEQMRMNRNWGLCLVALALTAGTCLAEDSVPSKFYKLDFTVKEVEGSKVLNTRTYSVMVAAETGGQKACLIRTGSKVPTVNGSPGANPQFTYIDLGVNIDCGSVVKEVPGGLSLGVNADISSALQEPATSPSLPPIIRQNRWSSSVVVPLKMQLELTATPIT